MEEWQAKHCGSPGTPRLSAASPISTGFLDGTHPIVDAYELKVWGLCRCSRVVRPHNIHCTATLFGVPTTGTGFHGEKTLRLTGWHGHCSEHRPLSVL